MNESCKILKLIKDRIAAGEKPEDVIPYSIECGNIDDYKEIVYFAAQVLPDGERKEFCKRRFNELCRPVRE